MQVTRSIFFKIFLNIFFFFLQNVILLIANLHMCAAAVLALNSIR